MKKGVLFLIFFLLIITGVYLYKKGFRNLQPAQKFFFKNQKVKTTVSQTFENQKELVVKETFQGITIEVYEPKDGQVVKNSNLTVKGKTAPLAEIFINEKELKADNQGNFNTSLFLDEGENIITVVASDEQGNYAEKELTVTLETVK